jgi:hypothetical protein
MHLGVKPAGGIDEQYVDTSAPGSLHAIVDNCGRIGTGSVFNQLHTGSAAPSFELFDRGCPECVTGNKEDLFAAGFILSGKLSYGGGFADAVDTEK